MRSIHLSQFYKSAWFLSAIALGQTMACSGDFGEGEEDVAEAVSGAEDPAPPSQESGSLDEASEPAGAAHLEGGAGAHQFIGAAPGSMPATGEDLAAGYEHTLFLRPDGEVWAWGARNRGQVGTVWSSSPQTTPIKVPVLPAIKAVAAGGSHSLALDKSGAVWAWGDNYYGQIGTGSVSSVTPQATPVKVQGLPAIKAIAAGGYHSLAIDVDGKIWVWGDNRRGQLGLGVPAGSSYPTPVEVNIEDGAAAIAAGGFFTLAVSKTGAVWSWGENGSGQIGKGVAGGGYQLAPYRVSFAGFPKNTAVVAVAGGRDHALALLSDGSLAAWGANTYGQLGLGNKTGGKYLPQKVQGLTGITITQIAGGYDFSVARSTAGAVWAWGNDGSGQLGDGSSSTLGSATPKEILGLNALAIATGDNHAAALGTDCSLLTWGSNVAGKLGNGNLSSGNVTAPTSVLAWTRSIYEDADQDGYGDPGAPGQATCAAPPGYVVNSDDCNDAAAGVHPGAADVCNGVDDNCAGGVDENNPGGGEACSTGQPGVCSAGTTQCSGGSIACNQNVAASAEVCDGLDNNCDGGVDENNAGGGAACATGLPGACGAGTMTCSNGALACNQDVQPSAEVCDGVDNDCDGTVDEDNPGGGEACVTGEPGVCSAGTTACSNGSLQCDRDVEASVEVCDGLDNNCDGGVDEDNAGGGAACATGQPGVCGAGTVTCLAGALVCGQNVARSAEACDGLDNDCDGRVDEGAATSTHYRDSDGDGYGDPADVETGCSPPSGYVTQGGDCNDAIAWVNPGELDAYCDGIDDDCDGSYDEDFVSTACDTGNPASPQGQTYCTAMGTVGCAPATP